MKIFDRSYHDVITLTKLLRAWRAFLRGKQKRTDVIMYQAQLIDNVYALQQDLAYKRYVHGRYKQFNISDPKPRIIHKATVRDRLLHHLLYQELYRYFDSHFIHDSYSCRRNKGTHRALYRFRQLARKVSNNHTQTCWVLKCDVRKFFASIDHEILKRILAHHIRDTDLAWLLGAVIDSFHSNGAHSVSLPLGNLTSQLFVNVYMNEFDHFITRQMRVSHYIRYADDFVVLSRDRTWLLQLLPLIDRFLREQLHLVLHPHKMSIETHASGVDFLGWVHFPHHAILRTTTKRRMLKNCADRPSDETVTSYLGLLQHGNTYKLRTELMRNTNSFV